MNDGQVEYDPSEEEINEITNRSMTIEELMEESHRTAMDKGWWKDGDRNFGEQIALMHTELSEALEEWRNFGFDPEKFIYYNVDSDKPDKPEGIAVELADLFIRIGDTCKKYGMPLQKALWLKMIYNKSRPYRHGGKLA